jgi:hypothetical protein
MGLTPMVAQAAYRRMIYEIGDEQVKAQFEDFTSPDNVVNPATGVPDWYGSDEEAWSDFLKALND